MKSKFKCLFLLVTSRGMTAIFQHKLKNIYLNISKIIQKQEPIIHQQVRHILRKNQNRVDGNFPLLFPFYDKPNWQSGPEQTCKLFSKQ